MTASYLQPGTMPDLFYGLEERVKSDDHLTAALCGSLYRIAALTELLPWIMERLGQGIVQPTHPRYFGLCNPAPTFPAACAERSVAAINPLLATATTSPIQSRARPL